METSPLSLAGGPSHGTGELVHEDWPIWKSRHAAEWPGLALQVCFLQAFVLP